MEVQVFNNLFKGKPVEVLTIEEEFYFNAQDVGACLGIKNIRDRIKDYEENQKIVLKNSNVGLTDFRKLANRGELFLTELGLYRTIFSSRVKEAVNFQNWVYTVLKDIRQNGYYIAKNITEDQLDQLTQEVSYYGQVIKSLKGQCAKQGQKIAQQNKDLAKFETIYGNKNTTYPMHQLASEFGTGSAMNLRSILLTKGVLRRELINGEALDFIAPNYHNLLIKGDLVKVKRWLYNGQIKQNLQWTEAGRVWLKNQLNKWGY